MKKIVILFNRMSLRKKVLFFSLFILLVLFISFGIPSLARYNNRVEVKPSLVWDGSVAEAYKSGTGTESDPYIISTASEFAYFASQASSTDYSGVYFKVTNNIKLNSGLFSYSDNKITYTLDNDTYYVNEYSNDYYEDELMENERVGVVNNFAPISSFNGIIDFDYHTIYGLYITSNTLSNLSLFNNIEGVVKNLYIDNSLVYGGVNSAILANNVTSGSVTDVVINGYVVGKTTDIQNTQDILLSDVSYGIGENTLSIDENVVGSIISSSLSGEYSLSSTSENTTISINGVLLSDNSFNIDLGSNMVTSIPVILTSDITDLTVNFTNLKYTVVREYASSAGIVNVLTDSTFDKIVNRSHVYGYSSSSIASVMTNSTISNSYNLGNINGTVSSGGIVGIVNGGSNNIISMSYNNGEVTGQNVGGLISKVYDSTISLDRVIDASQTDNIIYSSSNSMINTTNSYYTYGNNFEDKFIYTLSTNLYDETFMKNIGYNEFTDKTNLSNNSNYIWVYGYNELPVLYIDDANSIASVHVSSYFWNNFSDDLDRIDLGKNITFSIEEDELSIVDSKYYYISNNVLTYTQVDSITDWISYTDVVTINESGKYIIYAKIVDNNDNIYYMNTDLLALDNDGPTGDVSVLDKTYNTYFDSLDNIYSGNEIEVSVTATDNLSGMKEVSYYISNSILSIDELNTITDWTLYSESFKISEMGKYIVYFKLTDNNDNISYINTDYINYNGYVNDSIIIGKNKDNYTTTTYFINNKSIITLNYSFNSSNAITGNNTHKIVSNILLPQGTNIKIFDNILNKVYEYNIPTSNDIYNYNENCNLGICKSEYPFSLFKEIGGNEQYFSESNYVVDTSTKEDFTIMLDFLNTDFVIDYENVLVYLELFDENDEVIRSSVMNKVNSFSIYSTIDTFDTLANLYLSSNYSGESININSDLTTDISLNSGIYYKRLYENTVFDTRYEDMKLGLNLKIVDSSSNVITNNNLKNIMFEFKNKKYVFNDNNEINIDIESGISDSTNVLSLISSSDNSSLEVGTYYLKITLYTSYNGYSCDNITDKVVTIPLSILSEKPVTNYGFDVFLNEDDRVISKSQTTKMLSFDIIQYGLTNPSVKVSLYKKDLLTAYDQSYTAIDLQDYVSDSLEVYDNFKYNALNNPVVYDGKESTYNNFQLNLILSNFENNGYKIVFDLYDGDKKVGTIEKNFIVK